MARRIFLLKPNDPNRWPVNVGSRGPLDSCEAAVDRLRAEALPQGRRDEPAEWIPSSSS